MPTLSRLIRSAAANLDAAFDARVSAGRYAEAFLAPAAHLQGDATVASAGTGHSLLLDVLQSPMPVVPDEGKLFREEDLASWVVFALTVLFLIFFDLKVLHRTPSAPSLQEAMLHTLFWISCAGGFCMYISYAMGVEAAVNWGTGYLLEWMLSVDNLFVFHQIFAAFETPEEQKHVALYWGIFGALILRLLLFGVEQVLFHSVSWMHYVFGVFLIYTGVRAVMTSGEDGETEETPFYQFILRHLRYVDTYHPEGPRFFIWAKLDPEADPRSARQEYAWFGTRLLLVVVCLEMTDLMFAFDSVSAIVAQIPNLYLSFTACIFAMLGLRALFFIIDVLVKLFSLLNYGVSAILILIGLKLLLQSWVHIPPITMCLILLGTIATSIIASLVYDHFRLQYEQDDVKQCDSMSGPPTSGRLHALPSRLRPMPGTPLNSERHSHRQPRTPLAVRLAAK